MKLFTTILLSTLFCFSACAEVENFDMSLAGGFEKDYCSISPGIQSNASLDQENNSTTNPLDSNETYYQIANRADFVTCSNTLINIKLTTQTAGPTLDSPNNIKYASHASINYKGDATSGFFTQDQMLSKAISSDGTMFFITLTLFGAP